MRRAISASDGREVRPAPNQVLDTPTEVPEEPGVVPSPPLAEDIYEPSPGDVVRLSGLSDAKYDDKIARIISKVTNGDRVPVRILPNGPEIRILRIRATFPATCRMRGDRISDITCGTCFVP